MADYTLNFTASEINERLGKLDNMPLSMTLLWENASPTSGFKLQSFEINDDEYDFIALEYLISNSDTTGGQLVIIKSNGTGEMLYSFLDEYSELYNAFRDFRIKNNIITFESCFVASYSGMMGTDTMMIPYRIYGIKGVQ